MKDIEGILTSEQLRQLLPNSIIASGIIKNNPDGLFMTTSRLGDNLMWVAKKGTIDDWAIYIHWEESGIDFVISNGDKVTNIDYIKKLVPCSDEVLQMYRY